MEKKDPTIQIVTNDTTIHNEDRNFGGNRLYIDLVPKFGWQGEYGTAPISEWTPLREYVCQRVDHKCECCGIEATQKWSDKDRFVLGRYTYDEEKRMKKLMRLICLCHECYCSTHLGFVDDHEERKYLTEHLKKVGKFTDKELYDHIIEANRLYMERSKITWNIDFSIVHIKPTSLVIPYPPYPIDDEVTENRKNSCVIA